MHSTVGPSLQFNALHSLRPQFSSWLRAGFAARRRGVLPARAAGDSSFILIWATCRAASRPVSQARRCWGGWVNSRDNHLCLRTAGGRTPPAEAHASGDGGATAIPPAVARAAAGGGETAAVGAAGALLLPLGLEVYEEAFELSGFNTDAAMLRDLNHADLDAIQAASHVPILTEHRQRIIAASRAASRGTQQQVSSACTRACMRQRARVHTCSNHHMRALVACRRQARRLASLLLRSRLAPADSSRKRHRWRRNSHSSSCRVCRSHQQ